MQKNRNAFHTLCIKWPTKQVAPHAIPNKYGRIVSQIALIFSYPEGIASVIFL